MFAFDFIVLVMTPKDFNAIVFQMRDKALSITKEYPDPFHFCQKTEALKWISERLIRANIAVDDDVNVLIQNENGN